MEVQPVDLDYICRVFESALQVAVFPDPIPHPVRARFFVENALVSKRLFCLDDRFKRFVLNLHKLRRIVSQTRGFRHYGGDRLPLIECLADSHGEVANLLRVFWTDFNKWLCLCCNFFARQSAYHAW